MGTVLVTGGTGFLGRHVVQALRARGHRVRLLVRDPARHAARLAAWPGAEVVVGDLTARVEPTWIEGVDAVVHLAGVYDLDADEAALEAGNVAATQALVDLLRAARFPGVLLHVSTVAVAGDHTGPFDEATLDAGQGFPHAYHRTKHAAERIVRDSGLRWRIARPCALVGDRRTGEADRVDGAYHLFPLLKALRHALPGWVTVPSPLRGTFPVLPVDVAADVIGRLLDADGFDGRAVHVLDPDTPSIDRWLDVVSQAAGGPRIGRPAGGTLERLLPGAGAMIGELGAVKGLRQAAYDRLGVPATAVTARNLDVAYDPTNLRALLGDDRLPPLEAWAGPVWDFWARHLDPDREDVLVHRRAWAGQRVLITGGSSGVGAALAEHVAGLGATVILVARRADELEAVAARCRAAGGAAHVVPADLSEPAEVARVIAEVTAAHGGVDVLVNNAARSIRRAVADSVGRLHDHERVIRLNHLTPVQLTLGFLPGMIAQRHGHVVSVLTEGAFMPVPMFSAYASSKAALGAFSDTLAAEVLHEGVHVTSVFLPWVATPMMMATEKYREKAERGEAWTPGRAAAWIVDGVARRKRHLKSATITRRYVLNQLSPLAMTRALSYVFRLYHEDKARFPELRPDRKLFRRLFPTDLV